MSELNKFKRTRKKLMNISELLSNSIIFREKFVNGIVFTKQNPAIVETLEIKKLNLKVIKKKDIQTFYLKKFSCKISEVDKIINQEFIDVINSIQTSSLVDFYPKGMLSLFKKNKKSNLLNKIQHHDWILCSKNIKKNIPSDMNLTIFEDQSLTNEVYTGKFDSLLIIINTEYSINNDNIQFELLIYNKNVTRLILE